MKTKNLKGSSFIEIMIVVGLTAALFILVFNFGQSIFSFNSSAQENLSAQTGARKVLKTIVKELRSASPSSLGSYPVALASSTSLIFFSNIDNDSYKEQVRYFLSGTELKKGVIKPSGSPISYNPNNEEIITVISNVINTETTPVFDYFDSSYTGTSTPLAQPVQATSVRLIRITVNIEKDVNRSPAPIIVESQAFLRNLKDNL